MSNQGKLRYDLSSDEGRKAKDSKLRIESMKSAYNGFSSLSHELLTDGRRQLESLDEQIYQLGANCPKELWEARDEAAATSTHMNTMLEGYGNYLASWTRRFA